jgi:acetate kinase
VDYFCRQLSGAIGAFAARAGGIDALVFTGGIGEHADTVRAQVCAPLAFMGLQLDADANRRHDSRISVHTSKPVVRIPADEESLIRDLVVGQLSDDPAY